MTSKQTLTAWRWLAYDTFRQSLSGRLFWLMLGISAVVIVFCLGVSIQDGGPLHPPDDFELDRPHGVFVHPRTGELYVADSWNDRVLKVER